MHDAPRIAYIANGRLFLKRDEATPLEVASPFAEDVRLRASRIARKQDWKQQGTSAQFQRGMLWGGGFNPEDSQHNAVRFTALARGREGRLVYSIQSGPVAGVFTLDPKVDKPETSERRLFHTADLSIAHLSEPEVNGYLSCSSVARDGSHISVMSDDGSELTSLTEGDSVEAAPSWVPGADRKLVFQTAGIARNAQGHMSGLSAYAIHRLDVPTSAVTTLLEDPSHDFLGPHVLRDGSLICIRRPYEKPRQASPWRAMLDLVLFPFRIIFAFLQWLNFFTTRYTGNPLTTAGGPERKGIDAKQMMIWGNLVDANRAALDAETYGDDASSVVPRSWQLVKKCEGKPQVEVIAKGVVCFALTRDERLVFSNGNAIYALDEAGQRRKIASAERITSLVVLD